ncbi:MAG TPA: hypothetical protein VFT22_29150 [Kofleriaceae bacterium]|nr:hypothetical protein [Kofleriaceae bacterium]
MTRRGAARWTAVAGPAFPVLLALAACNAPAPSLKIAFAGPPSQECPSTACAGVPMLCPAVMSIRIIDPPEQSERDVLLSQCVEITPDRRMDMCVVASVDLESKALPVQDLEVQIALYPTGAVAFDAAGSPICPSMVQYSAATGFPVEEVPAPALGGRAYYHPGDQTVTVTLGCTDLAAINGSCSGSDLVTVSATVEDFSSQFRVTDEDLVSQLQVSVGEPSVQNGAYAFTVDDAVQLGRRDDRGPAWGGDIPFSFDNYACIEVLQTAAQSTATVTCKLLTQDTPLTLVGQWMVKKQLDAILAAINNGSLDFPPQGLTVGVVVDQIDTPVAGAVVSARQPTAQYPVTYLSKDGAATDDTGIFVARTAPFGTEFSTDLLVDGSSQHLTAIGGLISGRVTVVVLRPGGPTL